MTQDRPALRQPTTRRPVVRWVGQQAAPSSVDDDIAVEEPLEIRLASDALATLMRTPGEDHFLTAGFLYSEGIIESLADLGKIAHCGRPQDPGFGNIVDVSPGPGVAFAPELNARIQRSTLVSSACGVCGRQTIDDMLARTAPLPAGPIMPMSIVRSSQQQLAAEQRAFGRTGAMHGAWVCDAAGRAIDCSEDVGRHNAVDKVVGKLLFSGALSAAEQRAKVLAVSGRSCFEIVQKAALARIAIVISVGAPTSLAVDLADALELTLIGFARDEHFNIYTHPQRIVL
jgi:FdhD protein